MSQWFKKAKTQGVEALRHQPPPGATPKLSQEQQAQLPTLLEQGAEAFGFRGPDPGDLGWSQYSSLSGY